MKNVGDLMKRLQKMMPANVKPAFTTGEELLAWQKEQGEIRAAALARENRAMKMQRTFNRSGIRPLHQNCSFDNDIMSAMKDTFSNRETSEEQLLNDLSNVDLLVIDEIGVQTESRYEKVIINQIVDRRSSSKRPTGMLTNHNIDEMTRLLGERVMDRMKLGNSLYVIFDWESYRSRVTGKEY